MAGNLSHRMFDLNESPAEEMEDIPVTVPSEQMNPQFAPQTPSPARGDVTFQLQMGAPEGTCPLPGVSAYPSTPLTQAPDNLGQLEAARQGHSVEIAAADELNSYVRPDGHREGALTADHPRQFAMINSGSAPEDSTTSGCQNHAAPVQHAPKDERKIQDAQFQNRLQTPSAPHVEQIHDWPQSDLDPANHIGTSDQGAFLNKPPATMESPEQKVSPADEASRLKGKAPADETSLRKGKAKAVEDGPPSAERCIPTSLCNRCLGFFGAPATRPFYINEPQAGARHNDEDKPPVFKNADESSCKPPKPARHGPKSKSSEYRGVTFYKRTDRWESHIWHDNAQVYLGASKTKVEAARAYDKAALLLNGVEADINFQPEDYNEELSHLYKLSKNQLVIYLRRNSRGRGAEAKYPGVKAISPESFQAGYKHDLKRKLTTILGTYPTEEEAARALYKESVKKKNWVLRDLIVDTHHVRNLPSTTVQQRPPPGAKDSSCTREKETSDKKVTRKRSSPASNHKRSVRLRTTGAPAPAPSPTVPAPAPTPPTSAVKATRAHITNSPSCQRKTRSSRSVGCKPSVDPIAATQPAPASGGPERIPAPHGSGSGSPPDVLLRPASPSPVIAEGAPLPTDAPAPSSAAPPPNPHIATSPASESALPVTRTNPLGIFNANMFPNPPAILVPGSSAPISVEDDMFRVYYAYMAQISLTSILVARPQPKPWAPLQLAPAPTRVVRTVARRSWDIETPIVPDVGLARIVPTELSLMPGTAGDVLCESSPASEPPNEQETGDKDRADLSI